MSPTWPGGQSGVTIGIGYDLGQQTEDTIEKDLSRYFNKSTLNRLIACAGIKGQAARNKVSSLKDIKLPLPDAEDLFHNTHLVRYALLTKNLYPEMVDLPADAQSALVSLVYNRGTSVRGATRKEMLDIKKHVKDGNVEEIAKSIESMKRLWEGKNLGGLLRRRDDEAALVRTSLRKYTPEELIYI